MAMGEFVAQPGYTFTGQLFNPLNNYALLGSVTFASPIAGNGTVYRFDAGSVTGIAQLVATSGALRVVGYVNFDAPGVNGYCEVLDTLDAAIATKQILDSIESIQSDIEDIKNQPVSFSVLPGRDRGLPQSNHGKIVVAIGERIMIVRQVLDGNNNPVSLAGRTLEFVIEDARGNDVAVVPNASITVDGSNYSFVVPEAASAKVANHTYALNDLGTTKALLASGDWIVQSRPRSIA